MKSIRIENRRVYYDYFVLETLECGLSLRGNEVKSIYHGMCNINHAYLFIENNQLILRGAHITKWDTANIFDVDENRDIYLLAHKKEIIKFTSKIKEQGLTLIPLSIYMKNGKFKIEIGLCKGKKLYDKREAIKLRDLNRIKQF